MNRPAPLSHLALAALLALAGTVAPRAAAAEETLTADAIVQRALRASYYQGRDGRAQVSMRVLDDQGRERLRELIILRRDALPEGETDPTDEFTGDQKYYAYFRRPADVRKTVFLVWKHASMDRDDDRWLYLPDLDLVKRIASSEERTSFVGTHFFYEDVSGRTPDEDTHELVETTDSYYVLKHVPKAPDTVEFASYKTWIHRGTFIVTQTEYMDAHDKVYRTYKATKVEMIQDYPTVVGARMEDTRIGGYTEATYSDVQYNVGLPDSIFTERYLRSAPMQYLRGQ